MNNRMKDSVKTRLNAKASFQRIFMTLIFVVFIILGLAGGAQYSFHKTELSIQSDKCKSVKNDGFCDAVDAYQKYCKFINSEAICNVINDQHARWLGLPLVQKRNNLLVESWPSAADAFTETYDISTGKLIKLCGFWIGFHTQKGPCLEGEALDAYLDEMKKKRR